MSELLKLRDPKQNPAKGDAVLIGDTLFTVTSAEIGVSYDTLQRGRRRWRRWAARLI